MKRLEKALEHEVKLTRGKSPHYLRLLGFYFGDSGDGEPGITYLGITESGITESGITWVMGIGHNRNWYNGISYNIEVECGIT